MQWVYGGTLAALLLLCLFPLLVPGWSAPPRVGLQSYNPGLVTSFVLFVPLGAHAVWQIQRTGGGTAKHHTIGLGAAIGIHTAIVVYALAGRV